MNDGAFISLRSTVLGSECDHMGHMNVRHYVGKFDDATWNFFNRIGLTPSFFRDSDRGMAAVEMHIEYKAELLVGDVITITTRLLEVKPKAIIFRHDMYNGETGQHAASMNAVAVHLDSVRRRAVAFSDELKAKMDAVQREDSQISS
ncbi:MAG: thioesterase [Hyphomicrobiales bacterium]|nr:MAG: thioesterase [Hyphomicrobiales bacterium]